MTPQLVDFNADGYQDMVMATFEGTVFLVEGSETGFNDPVHIRDKNDELIRISMYWDLDESKYMYVDRTPEDEDYIKEHHMTSTYVVDWDADGDHDLLLGAYEGALYLCLNEGTNSEPKFSDKNLQVKAGGKHLTLSGGLATPIVCDWNGDGLFDILCGGSKGGVFYYENIGEDGAPEFAAAETLVEKYKSKSKSRDYYASMSVPVVNGKPACPATGFHIETTDYDGDGDLDLLVGGQCFYAKEAKELTAEEEAEYEEIKAEQEAVQKQMSEMTQEIMKAAQSEEASSDEINKAFQELNENEEYIEIRTKYMELYQRAEEIKPSPRAENHVWLFRNKSKASSE